jgi:hypothetical protein
LTEVFFENATHYGGHGQLAVLVMKGVRHFEDSPGRVTTDGGRFQRRTLFEHAPELVAAAMAEEKNKEWTGYDARWGDAGEHRSF